MGENTKSKPAYEAFVVDETGSSPYWTKIGAAWKHEDGKGLNVSLAAGIAVSGKLVLRAPDGGKQKAPTKK